MNPEFLDRAPVAAVVKSRERARRRRALEYDDASDFLYRGDDEGRHAVICVHPTPCSRVYNPRPDAQSAPADPSLYEGTGIGGLYGDAAGGRLLWQLAGWTLGRGGL